jgi:hypothetical protein
MEVQMPSLPTPSFRLFLSLILAATLAGLITSAGALPAVQDPGIVAEFDELIEYVESIPGNVLNRGLKSSFSQRLGNAKRSYEQGQLCAAANMLQAHMNQAQALRQGREIPVAEDLYNRGRRLRQLVLGSAHPPDPCADASIGRAPEVEILASDNQQFAARVSFGAAEMWTVEAGGETWTQMSLPGIENLMGDPGHPSVPSWQALVAVPHGARAQISDLEFIGRQAVRLNLYPFQEQAADQTDERFAEDPVPPDETFMDPPFVKNERTYALNQFLPPTPCAIRPLGELRDLELVQIQCSAGQYNPVTGEMILYESVQFKASFDGGEGTFITTQTLSPFEPASQQATTTVLNYAVLAEYVKQLDFTSLVCHGEELLVLSHPNFRDAANDLVQWKRDKGILTNVFNVGAGTPRPTAAAINDFIEGRYQNCKVRPSYVLLIGDSEFVPPARLDYDTTPACGNCGDETTGSDWGYATYSKSLLDFLPWFAVGRIPVDTAAEAQTVVDKTIQYESSPPFLGFGSGGPFYTTATNASYFQCCRTDTADAGRSMRTFIQTSELVRNVMLGRGYSVERIYTTDTDYQKNPVADPTPRRYHSGALLPGDLGAGSGFAWDGNTADVLDAINAGRFLVLHRGHGWSGGWADPKFSTNNLINLWNGGLLPFVYSINCASGYWDRETDTGGTTESFMEHILMRSGGGMVAGIGDNRNSPTWANSAIARGFYDATFPNVAPEFGGNVSKRRLGDILNHGKLYLATQIGVAQPAGSVSIEQVLAQWIMYGAFGDPTIEMWTANPHQFILPLTFELFVERDSLILRYPVERARITAFQQAREGLVPIGRGDVVDGEARLAFFAELDPDLPVILSASKPNAVSVLLTRGASPDLVNR